MHLRKPKYLLGGRNKWKKLNKYPYLNLVWKQKQPLLKRPQQNENAVEVTPITEEQPPVATVSKSSLTDAVEPAETQAAKSSLAEIAKNTSIGDDGLTQYGEVIHNVDKIAKKPRTNLTGSAHEKRRNLVCSQSRYINWLNT